MNLPAHRPTPPTQSILDGSRSLPPKSWIMYGNPILILCGFERFFLHANTDEIKTFLPFKIGRFFSLAEGVGEALESWLNSSTTPTRRSSGKKRISCVESNKESSGIPQLIVWHLECVRPKKAHNPPLPVRASCSLGRIMLLNF